MFCSKCGAQIPDGTSICNNCMTTAQAATTEQGAQQVQQQMPPQYAPGQVPFGQPNYQQPMGNQGVYGQPQFYGEHPGEKPAKTSLICGIIGIFVAGLILGIIAIVQGNKAKKLGFTDGKATAGIVLGIVDIILWAFLTISFFSSFANSLSYYM